MNEAIVLNDPDYAEAGLLARMIDLQITEDERGLKIEMDAIILGQQQKMIYRDPLAFMREWRLSDSYIPPAPWEEHSMEQVCIEATNMQSGIDTSVQRSKETKTLNDLFEVS